MVYSRWLLAANIDYPALWPVAVVSSVASPGPEVGSNGEGGVWVVRKEGFPAMMGRKLRGSAQDNNLCESHQNKHIHTYTQTYRASSSWSTCLLTFNKSGIFISLASEAAS